jgi:tetratricopeptide (TPR) repeat protein
MDITRLGRSAIGLLVLSISLAVAPGARSAAPLAPDALADARIPPDLAAEEAHLAEQFRRPPISLDTLVQLADLRARIAEALARVGERERAADYLLASLDLVPDRGERWERLGDLAAQSGRDQDRALAEQAWRQVLGLDPGHRGARVKLSGLAMARHAYPEAVVHLEVALADQRVGAEWLSVATLTGLYALTGQTERGRRYFSKLARATGDDRLVLADAILMQVAGDGKNAAKRLKDIQGSPVTPELLKRYAERLQGEFEPGVLDGLIKWLK